MINIDFQEIFKSKLAYRIRIITLPLLMLLVPNFYLCLHGSDFLSASFMKMFLFLLLSASLITCPLILIPPKKYFIFCIIWAVLAPFEVIHIYLYKASINAGIIYTIFHTNSKETGEFLIGILPFTIGSIIYIGTYILLVTKYFSYKKRISIKSRILLGLFLILLIMGLWLRDLNISKGLNPSLGYKEIVSIGTNNFSNKFKKIYPGIILFRTNDALTNLRTINLYKSKLGKFRFHALKKDALLEKERYVLIIGESSRSYNWQLYGYTRETNPLLTKDRNLIVLKQFHSTANLTAISIPQILTRATPDSVSISFKEKTLISAFKECGFKTYWISNQGVFGSDLARFTLDIDKVYDLNSNIDFGENYDEHVFPFLDSVLQKSDSKQLIIINLMGSHFRYSFRYPQKYNLFKPGFDGAFDYLMIKPENRDRLINIYDNSILYTDYILSEINKRIEATNSISLMIYLSDHGENLFDTSDFLFGHGTIQPNKYELEVPCIIWPSVKYKIAYGEKICYLDQNKNKKASTSNIFYSLLDAANITCPVQRLKKSFLSVKFEPDSFRRVLLPNMKVIDFR